uniref:helix-turn-helix domain-containing protein n=2 Tax=Paraburkholderia sediminicola TaxID=458836 RepID=UPI0038B76353
MCPATLVTLNMRELDRLKVIQAIVDMGLKPGRAAERLQLCERQVSRLVRRCRTGGTGVVVTRRRPAATSRRRLTGTANPRRLRWIRAAPIWPR